MAFNSNPMGIQGPPSNYVQPASGNPTAQPAVASYAIGWNVLNLTWPLTLYTQPDFKTTPFPPSPAWPLGSSPILTLQ